MDAFEVFADGWYCLGVPKEERTYPVWFEEQPIRRAASRMLQLATDEWERVFELREDRKLIVHPSHDRTVYPDTEEEFFDLRRRHRGSNSAYRRAWQGRIEQYEVASVTVTYSGTGSTSTVSLRYPREEIVSELFSYFETALGVPQSAPSSADRREDQQIVEALGDQEIWDAARCYQQALRDASADDRLSWRGPANELREALRETLNHLAPKDEVEAAPGYKPEPNTTGPTLKQRTKHALKKRRRAKQAAEVVTRHAATVDELMGQFLRSVYSHGSANVHTHAGEKEYERLHRHVRTLMFDLLDIEQGD